MNKKIEKKNKFKWLKVTWRFLPAWLLHVVRSASKRGDATRGSILSLKLLVRNNCGTASFFSGVGGASGGGGVSAGGGASAGGVGVAIPASIDVLSGFFELLRLFRRLEQQQKKRNYLNSFNWFLKKLLKKNY